LKINEIALDVLKDVTKIVYTFILFYFILLECEERTTEKELGVCVVCGVPKEQNRKLKSI
jgi:hypothetical protein